MDKLTKEEIFDQSEIGKYLRGFKMDYMRQNAIEAMTLYAQLTLDEVLNVGVKTLDEGYTMFNREAVRELRERL